MRTILTGTLLLLAVPATAAEWEQMTTDLAKKEKAAFGGICGVLVNRSNGHVYLNVSDKGLYSSTDGGKTWSPYAIPFKGRTEWPGCMMFDPSGTKPTMFLALVYGAPARFWSLNGEQWQEMDKKASHIDWCVVDWTDPEKKFVLAMKHESGGVLLVSHDGGKSFTETGKGFAAAWILDADTAVAAEMKSKDKPKPGLVRSTDGGKTWKPCGDYSAQALPKWFDGKLYWVVDGALLTTTDKGESWKKICDLKDGKYGPVFGKTAQQMFVLTPAGVLETTDGGATWSKPVPLPKDLKGWSPLTWLDYDPVNDALYVMKMGSELFRMARK